jgi:hypothetical protein
VNSSPTLTECRDDLVRDFSQRVEERGLHEKRVTVAGRAVTFRFAGGHLVDDLTGSFAHLPPPPAAETSSLTVDCWVAEPDDPPALPQAAFPDAADDSRRADDHDLKVIYDWHGRTLTVFDRAAGHAWRCCVDPGEISWWEIAAPMRSLMSWHLDAVGSSFLHGAAVGHGDDAVLLAGPSGAGKSTTALSCLMAGLTFLGDDFCAGTHPDNRVHSLYGSAKLDPAGVDGFDRLVADVDSLPRGEKQKVTVWPNKTMPDQMVTSAAVRALVAPRVGSGTTSTWRPTSAARTLVALAPSSILQLPVPGASSLARMADLARNVPAWELTLGSDPAGVVDAVEAILSASTP